MNRCETRTKAAALLTALTECQFATWEASYLAADALRRAASDLQSRADKGNARADNTIGLALKAAEQLDETRTPAVQDEAMAYVQAVRGRRLRTETERNDDDYDDA